MSAGGAGAPRAWVRGPRGIWKEVRLGPAGPVAGRPGGCSGEPGGWLREAVLSAAGVPSVLNGVDLAAVAGGAGAPSVRVRCGASGGWGGGARGEVVAAHARGAPPVEVRVELRALGGKGGFGANLRGAGQKGQKVTNFDACRTLDGRRVRHERAEAELAQWEAEEEQRTLERAAEKHARSVARRGALEDEGTAALGEWRDTAERCAEGAARAVRDALGKRPAEDLAAKVPAAGGGSKRPRVMWGALSGSSDSDSGSSEDDGERPVVIVVDEGPSGSRPLRRRGAGAGSSGQNESEG